ncbi:MAG: glutathione-dependent formaldehyde dehydrogenase [Phycisphaerae bacterium]|nr:glutathione-dependent formaldehyde dehydrogenase [Phycisphaerae bacterium]
MKAVVFHDVGDIRVDEVPEPKIEQSHDAIVRLTVSAICGTDLHMVRGTMADMKPGTILGHEGVGIVEQAGPQVRNVKEGDRVVICSTIACGYCSYCRAGYYAQCDNANPNGARAGTCFFGGPKSTGPIDGLQAEKARVPFANVGLVKVPDEISDDQAILLSDIFPTGYFGADLAEIKSGDTVAVFGCGPVGQFAILSAELLGAGRILAVDRIESRLATARDLGAEVINFEAEDPVEEIMALTGGIGVDRAIDAVGIEAEHAESGPAAQEASGEKAARFARQREQVAPKTAPSGDLWQPGSAPSQAVEWCVRSLAKAGTLSVIGVYPPTVNFFPFGKAMNMNLTINMGNCNHRKYVSLLMELVLSGAVHPEKVLTEAETLTYAIDAYEHFDRRESGWLKTALLPVEAAV